MKGTLLVVLLAAGVCLSSSCARHVVVEASAIGDRKSADWTVKSVPRPAAGSVTADEGEEE